MVDPVHRMHLAEDFDRLYRAHYDFVWRNARHLGVPPETLDDVLQETFLIAYRRLPEFDGRAKPSTWLYGILHNVWRNHRRGSRRSDRKRLAWSERIDLDAQQRLRASEFEAQAELAQRLLAEFLASLDHRQRAAFVLAELEGLTGPELASALGINLNTARARLRAARQAFDRHFQAPPAGEAQPAVLALARSLRSDPPRDSERRREHTRATLLACLAPPEAGATLGTLGLAKLVPALVGLGLAAAVAVGVVVGRSHAPIPGPRLEPAAVAQPSPRIAAAPPRPHEPEPAAELPVVVEAEPVARQRPTPERSRDDSDYATLELARSALARGEPERALRSIATLEPEGPLAWEQAVTRVAALCQLDRNDDAKQVAERWNARDQSRAIADVCW